MHTSRIAVVILLGVVFFSGCMGQSDNTPPTTTPLMPEGAIPLSAAHVAAVRDAWDQQMPRTEQTLEDLEEQFEMAVRIALATNDATDLEGVMACYEEFLAYYLLGTTESTTATVLLDRSAPADGDMLLIDKARVPFAHPDGGISPDGLDMYVQQRTALESDIDAMVERLRGGDATCGEAMALFESYFSFVREYATMNERSVYTVLGSQLYSQSLESDVIIRGCDPYCIGCVYHDPPDSCPMWVTPIAGSPYSAERVYETKALWSNRLPDAEEDYVQARERVMMLLAQEGGWSQRQKNEMRTAIEDYLRCAAYQAWGMYNHAIVATMAAHTVPLDNDMLLIDDTALQGYGYMPPEEVDAHEAVLQEELAAMNTQLELLLGAKEWDEIWGIAMRRSFESFAEWYEDYAETSASHARDTVLHMLARQGEQQRILAFDCIPQCVFIRYAKQYPFP
ncbi:hypothetical protein EF808_06260 [archaeon]|nr:MAG: hypothetical protein EF808_06260 [archaeon]